MIKKLQVVSLALALVACSPEKPAAPAEQDQSANVVPVQTPAVRGFVYTPLPDYVVIDTPFHVRSDRIYATKNGIMRRRSTLELLQGGAVPVATAISEELTAAGFRAVDVKDKGDGITRLGFLKKGTGRINVSATPEVGEKPSNPKAVGVVSIDWPVNQTATTSAGSLSPGG
jgi:hypothetical protein